MWWRTCIAAATRRHRIDGRGHCNPDNFTDYEPSNAFGIFDFENVGHHFLHEPGNFVPAGGTFEIGLQQDVWDWFVTAATAHTTGGDFVPISLVMFLPFYELGLAPSAPSGGDAPSSILLEEGPPPVRARGLKLVNSDTPTTLHAIAFADVEKGGMHARQVHAKTWERLVRQGRVQNVPIPPFTLRPGDEFLVLFEGDVSALPADVLARGNYTVVRAPGLLDRKIFAAARSSDGNFLVQSFGLINDDPITGRRHGRPETPGRGHAK